MSFIKEDVLSYKTCLKLDFNLIANSFFLVKYDADIFLTKYSKELICNADNGGI